MGPVSVIRMSVLSVVLLGVGQAAAGAPVNALSPQEVDDGWLLLFDGETAFGWLAHGASKVYPKDGMLVVEPGRHGWVSTTTQFAALVMRCQIKTRARHPVALACCVLPHTEAGKEGLKPIGVGYRGLELAMTDVGRADWQDLEVRVEGKAIALRLGGKVVIERKLQHSARGHIGFLCEDGDARIMLRNVALKPLGLQAIFNGKDLTGWKPYPGKAGTYTVEPGGVLHAVGGLGSITAPGLYKDFVLQLDGKTGAKGFQNSGIFFRSIPGAFIQGYEIQIFNEWEGNDRTKPKDWGTGAVYRRQAARKVWSNKGEWFTMTIIAHGKHIATWVNGHQTADWIDNRPRHKNPRRGYRPEAGEIIIQAHDKNSLLWFRDIRIDEYPDVPVTP